MKFLKSFYTIVTTLSTSAMGVVWRDGWGMGVETGWKKET